MRAILPVLAALFGAGAIIVVAFIVGHRSPVEGYDDDDVPGGFV